MQGGHFSTVWLASDLNVPDDHPHKLVALKIQKSAQKYTATALDEIKLLQDLEKNKAPEGGDGSEFCVLLLDHFILYGPHGKHVCLVLEAMGGGHLLSLIRLYEHRGVSLLLCKIMAKQMLLGLSFLANKCKIIHTDIKPENFLLLPFEPYKLEDIQAQRTASNSPDSRHKRVGPSAGKNGKDSHPAHDGPAETAAVSWSGNDTQASTQTTNGLSQTSSFSTSDTPQQAATGNSRTASASSSTTSSTTSTLSSATTSTKTLSKNQKKKLKAKRKKKEKKKQQQQQQEQQLDGELTVEQDENNNKNNNNSNNNKNNHAGGGTGHVTSPSPSSRNGNVAQQDETDTADQPEQQQQQQQQQQQLSQDMAETETTEATEATEAETTETTDSFLAESVAADPAGAAAPGVANGKGKGAGGGSGAAARADRRRQIRRQKALAKAVQRQSITPKLREVVVKIGDLGNACWTHKHFTSDVTTREYRPPEVIAGCPYSTPLDVWSVACTLFEMATGDYLFNPKQDKYGRHDRDEDHLALMMELLGKMPKKITTQGKYSKEFFNRKGELHNIKKLNMWPLEDVLKEKYKFDAEESRAFSNFLLPMLNLSANNRATADQMLIHPWLELTEQDQRAHEQWVQPVAPVRGARLVLLRAQRQRVREAQAPRALLHVALQRAAKLEIAQDVRPRHRRRQGQAQQGDPGGAQHALPVVRPTLLGERDRRAPLSVLGVMVEVIGNGRKQQALQVPQGLRRPLGRRIAPLHGGVRQGLAVQGVLASDQRRFGFGSPAGLSVASAVPDHKSRQSATAAWSNWPSGGEVEEDNNDEQLGGGDEEGEEEVWETVEVMESGDEEGRVEF
eukprot:g52407.t1